MHHLVIAKLAEIRGGIGVEGCRRLGRHSAETKAGIPALLPQTRVEEVPEVTLGRRV